MISTYVSIVLLSVSIVSLIFSIWNAFQQAIIGRIIAELHLNIRTEMNGKYITISSFQDAKDRIARLERDHDETSPKNVV